MDQKKKYCSSLTIAGSDSGGGAGIQADIKTFSALGVFGMSVITAITAQNTTEVRRVELVSPEMVRLQLETVLDDIKVDSVKTGMLPSPEIIEVFALVVDKYKLKNIVIDPVMVATSGARLSPASTSVFFRKFLYERLTVLTPNIPEAEVLSGIEINDEEDMEKAGKILIGQGCNAVLVKGGHLARPIVKDILLQKNKNVEYFSSEFSNTKNLHGTGCSLASAISANLALGYDLKKAVELSKEFITKAIISGRNIVTGNGNGPVNHFFDPKPLKTINL